MKALTINQIMGFDPCYTRERVAALFGNRTEATLAEILDAPIPAEDRVWVLTRLDVLTPEQRQRFASLTADRAVRNHALHCGVELVEAWAARWLSGEDRSEATARAAAADAADADAADAAADAADAAAAAATATAGAWSATAAAAAAMSAEREAQVRDLRAILGGER